jgi:hypothetical protein
MAQAILQPCVLCLPCLPPARSPCAPQHRHASSRAARPPAAPPQGFLQEPDEPPRERVQRGARRPRLARAPGAAGFLSASALRHLPKRPAPRLQQPQALQAHTLGPPPPNPPGYPPGPGQGRDARRTAADPSDAGQLQVAQPADAAGARPVRWAGAGARRCQGEDSSGGARSSSHGLPPCLVQTGALSDPFPRPLTQPPTIHPTNHLQAARAAAGLVQPGAGREAPGPPAPLAGPREPP